jgi:hypothetical protein
LIICPLGAPELGETLFSPPLYRQRYQAVLTYLAEEQQNVGTIQVTPPQSPLIFAFVFGIFYVLSDVQFLLGPYGTFCIFSIFLDLSQLYFCLSAAFAPFFSVLDTVATVPHILPSLSSSSAMSLLFFNILLFNIQ